MKFLVYCNFSKQPPSVAHIEAELRSASKELLRLSDYLWLLDVSDEQGGNPIPDQMNIYYGKLSNFIDENRDTVLITRLDEEYLLITNDRKALGFRNK